MIDFFNTASADALSEAAPMYISLTAQKEGEQAKVIGRDRVIVAKEGDMEGLVKSLIERKEEQEGQVEIIEIEIDQAE